jgi:hypothetical protein
MTKVVRGEMPFRESAKLFPWEAMEIEAYLLEQSGSKLTLFQDRLIKQLKSTGRATMKDDECLITHTAYIRDAIEALGVETDFQTAARGGLDGLPNCYLKPIEDGKFWCYRFGGNEPTWTPKNNDWWCEFGLRLN